MRELAEMAPVSTSSLDQFTVAGTTWRGWKGQAQG